MIMVIAFFLILNQMEFHLVQNLMEYCHHYHIHFNLKGNGNIVFLVCLNGSSDGRIVRSLFVIYVWAGYVGHFTSQFLCKSRDGEAGLWYHHLPPILGQGMQVTLHSQKHNLRFILNRKEYYRNDSFHFDYDSRNLEFPFGS